MITETSLLAKNKRNYFGYTEGNGQHQVGIIELPFNSYGNGDRSVIALSLVFDALWEYFDSSERFQILLKVLEDIRRPTDGLRAWVSNPQNIHQNNHLQRRAGALLYAAIVFNDYPAYPEANEDINLARYLLFTYQNNLVVRMTDPEGASQEGTFYGCLQFARIINEMYALNRWDNTNYFLQEPFLSRLTNAPKWYCYEILPAPRSALYRRSIILVIVTRGFITLMDFGLVCCFLAVHIITHWLLGYLIILQQALIIC